MNGGTSNIGEQAVEAALRDELVVADAMIDAAVPMLRHLLANDDPSLFSEEIVARVRGMCADIARQLVLALTQAAGEDDPDSFVGLYERGIQAGLLQQAALLSHLHGIALEWQLTERLQAREALDPVLTPLVQSLVASSESSTAASAMAFLAAQVRFMQQQRRMELPLKELPGDLFHLALVAMRAQAADLSEDVTVAAEDTLRSGFDEAATRLGLATRLVIDMGGGSLAALSVDHAGTALYLSALSHIAGLDRALVILSANQAHQVRHALALRAAGVKPASIRDQLERICGEGGLASEFETLSVERARTLLAASSVGQAG